MFLFLLHISSIKCLNDYSYVTKYNPLHQVISNLHICLVISTMHKTKSICSKIKKQKLHIQFNFQPILILPLLWPTFFLSQCLTATSIGFTIMPIATTCISLLFTYLLWCFHCLQPCPHHYLKLFKMSPMLVMLVFKTLTKLIFPIMSLARDILGFNASFWNMFRMFVLITFAISTNTIRTH